MKNFIVCDGHIKKICRYQQFFTIKNISDRVSNITEKGNREVRIIWHTQGFGKSLTIVMTTSMILNHRSIKNPQTIIVTDKRDLDDQIHDTFFKL